MTVPPNPSLTRLRKFTGTWKMTSPDFPGSTARASYSWLDRGAFLICRANARAPFPSNIWVIGRDDKGAAFRALYYDSRGVSRVYDMTLTGRVWRLGRKAPGFSQRFKGTFSADSRTITGRWEQSRDGRRWRKDFDVVYTKT